MGLGALQQCVIIGCNIFVKSFSELQKHWNISKRICSMYLWQNITFFLLKKVLHEWGGFLNLKRLQIGPFD